LNGRMISEWLLKKTSKEAVPAWLRNYHRVCLKGLRKLTASFGIVSVTPKIRAGLPSNMSAASPFGLHGVTSQTTAICTQAADHGPRFSCRSSVMPGMTVARDGAAERAYMNGSNLSHSNNFPVSDGTMLHWMYA
jgi:hypothetical protein